MADIQMLAMLACVLQDSSKAMPTLPVNGLSGQDSRQYSRLPWLEPQASVERYFPSPEVAASILRPWMTQPAFALDIPKASSDPHSAASSVAASTSSPLTPFSASLTPPTSFKMHKGKHERSISQAPISASPEQLKPLHRAGSNLASTLAASITRPFSFNTPESASPPTTHPKRRSSPVASHLGIMYPDSSRIPSVQSKPMSPPVPNERRDLIKGSPAIFETKLKNQDQFHNDGYAADPLLDPSKEEVYAAYRSTYASVLLTWNLPIASCKVLQYNASVHPQLKSHNKGDYRERESLITMGRGASAVSTQAPTDLRLDIRNQCHRCSSTLPPGAAGKKCLTCSTKQAPVLCHLCHCIITGLSSPCLNCGHVLHLSCRVSLQETEDPDLDGECPTGCGCFCADHLTVNVPRPPSPAARKHSASTVPLFANEQEEFGWRGIDGETQGVDDHENEAWEDLAPVAYESLARNLGPRALRSLTPRPSQIWRGGETRKLSIGAGSKTRRSGSG